MDSGDVGDQDDVCPNICRRGGDIVAGDERLDSLASHAHCCRDGQAQDHLRRAGGDVATYRGHTEGAGDSEAGVNDLK